MTSLGNAAGVESEPLEHGIAVIGMAGRFPGADGIDAMWANLKAGRDTISRFSEEELTDSFSDEIRRDPNFVRARSVLENVDLFDPNFFGMQTREAAITDPQHRILLELAWAALEDGGVDPERFDGPIGMFAGVGFNTYFLKHVLQDRKSIEEYVSNHLIGEYPKMIGAVSDFSATKVAYKLGLTGPAMAIGAGCSTSLLTIAQACQSLQMLQCDVALAGGAAIGFPQNRGYIYTEGGIASKDGYCRPYDHNAVGTVFGHGAGVVMLKRLEDALEDGDQIYAVIGGYGVANDGKDKVGYTAPSVAGQVAAMASAYAMAGFDPRTIGYIEGHGTATPLGDPIEFEALKEAFSDTEALGDTGFCYLGSGKANYGHLDSASGVAGFIKAALTVKHGEIPPLLHFERPNPNIDLASSPFAINKELVKWERGAAPRRAAVNALGVGGTNVHVALEEPPVVEREAPVEGLQPIVVSARSKEALAAAAAQLADRLERDDAPALADVAFTLREGRRAFDHRAVVAAATPAEAAQKLRTLRPTGVVAAKSPRVAFMFPGQGAQYPAMARALYDSDPAFKMRCDVGLQLLREEFEDDLRGMIFGEAPEDVSEHPIRQTHFAQPALYVVEHAMAQYWMDRGVEPDAMIGHSVGEYVAATLAGVFSFEDGVKLIAARGKLMQAREPGAMLSVRLSEEELRPLLSEGVEIATINAPTLCVAAGTFEAVGALEAALTAKDITHRRLHTSHAFHSAMMDEAVPGLEEVARSIALSAPEKPFISCVTGDWITASDATSPAYWGRHLRAPVRFADGLRAMLEGVGGDRGVALLECGPGRALSTFAGQLQSKEPEAKAAIAGQIETMPDFAGRDEAEAVLAAAVGGLWAAGVEIDWDQFFGESDGHTVSLPTYPFERKSCWIDAPAYDRNGGAPAAAAAPTAANPASAALEQIAAMSAQLNASAPAEAPSAPAEPVDRKALIVKEIVAMLEDLSGDDLTGVDPETGFLDLGFDSLLMGQVAQKLKKLSGVSLTFRQILSNYPTIQALADHVDATASADKFAAAAPAAAPAAGASAAQLAALAAGAAQSEGAAAGGLDGLIRQQLTAMQQLITAQLSAFSGGAPAVQAGGSLEEYSDLPQAKSGPSRFDLMRGGTGAAAEITPDQRAYIDRLVASLCAKMPNSKEQVQRFRKVLSDPRTAAGFRVDWKQLVFPIVSDRSKGSRIWDVDGNEYIDLVSGYGQTFFGHSANLVVEAVSAQAQKSFAIGPQTPLAFECAEKFAAMTKNERVTFCNTGSEAVMAAMRVARAHTGREKVVVFSGDYHGQFDEVLVKPGKKRALPMASGIPDSSVNNMIVLPYGKPESAAWIQKHIEDIAAVVVEPVQSRNPDLRPFDFVRDLRRITEQGGAALVMDEVVTGFRVHLAGMQEVIGVKADMATYGKVLGGGMPLGILAGKSEWMDVLDGGHWSYGDDSAPEVAPTFFAGTFVRHPLVLAATRAVLNYFEEQGQQLLDGVAEKAVDLAAYMNGELQARGVGAHVEQYSSWIYFYPAKADPLGSLFFPTMRDLGVNMQEGFGSFLTIAHSDDDLAKIKAAFSEALDRLQEVGILTGGVADAAPAPKVEAAAPQAYAPVSKPTPAMIPVADLPDAVPLTEPMMEILVSSQFSDEANCAFNEGLTIKFDRGFDYDAMTRAIHQVVARHEGLRARFDIEEEKMRVVQNLAINVLRKDVSAAADPDAALHDLVNAEVDTPFDLENGPLFRAQIVTLGNDRHAVVIFGHHIVLDGWSLGVVTSELAEIYREITTGEKADLQPAMPLREYALSAFQIDEKAEAFWRDMYKETPEVPQLPTDHPRPSVRDYAGATYVDFIPAEEYAAVKKAGAKLGATPFSFYLAATQATMARLCDTPDTPVHIAMAGQTQVEDRALVGHCVAALPLRVPFDWSDSFADHVKRVQHANFEANDNLNYTIGTLVRRLNPPRDLGRAPISDICFNLERVGGALDFGGSQQIDMIPAHRNYVHFDFSINMMEDKGGLRIDVDYNTALLEESTIARWIGHLRALSASAIETAETPIGQMPMHTPEQLGAVLALGEGESVQVDLSRGLHQLIADRAAEAPQREAVRCGSDALTYGELDQAANRLARFLIEGLGGAQDGAVVGLCLERSVDYVVAMLAALKAGCAYAPLDPGHPRERRATALKVAGAVGLICADDESAAAAAHGEKVFRIDADHAQITAMADGPVPSAMAPVGDRPAYVIFTSGSTGAPKGVSVPHHSTVNIVHEAATRGPSLRPGGTVLATSAFIFDTSITDFFVPLTTGGRMVIADKDTYRDGFALSELLEEIEPDYMDAPPSIWRLLKEAGWTPHRTLHAGCGGEALSRGLADWILSSGARLFNLYGPTETSCWSTSGEIVADGADVTIGAPVINTRIRLVDERGQLAPIGAAGELLIAGAGLAHGYVNRPDLTEKAFVEMSIGGQPVERWYRTNDLGRLLPDGRIALIGRRDHQIKLRGFRIELEEIETVMAQAPGVQAAAAALEGDNPETQQIVGYYVAAAGAAPIGQDLASFVSGRLPSYMVPSSWVRLQELPLLSNGKLNRKGLAQAQHADAPTELAAADVEERRASVGEKPRLSDFFGGSRRRGRK